MKKETFNIVSYQSILELAKRKGYSISTFAQSEKARPPVLILRHDVDMNLETALAMAKVEHKMNIRSTYFILLYNNFYNPLSPEGKVIIRKLAALGNEIGIHWDSRDYAPGNKKLFKRDIELLSEIIGVPIVSGSQHEPTSTPLMNAPENLIYEAYRDFKDFVYVSDSSMSWRQYTPWDLIDKKENIQFLAHPFWWIMKGKTREKKVSYFLFVLSKLNKTKVNKFYKDLKNFLKVRDIRDKHFGYKNKKI